MSFNFYAKRKNPGVRGLKSNFATNAVERKYVLIKAKHKKH